MPDAITPACGRACARSRQGAAPETTAADADCRRQLHRRDRLATGRLRLLVLMLLAATGLVQALVTCFRL